MTSSRSTQTGPRPSTAYPSTSRRESSSASSGPTARARAPPSRFSRRSCRKTSGSVSVAGYDLDNNPKEIRKLIGVQSQETSVDPELTGRENMILQGHLQQMSGKELEDRVDYLLEVVGLKDAADKRAGRYSGGMKKRLDLASTLVHKPKVLFLDEPTTGLDPQSRATVWDYLEELNKKEGITIFLTTQYLEEADRLCQRLCIVDAGKIVAEGSPLGLKKEIGADAITISVQNRTGAGDKTRYKGRSQGAPLEDTRSDGRRRLGGGPHALREERRALRPRARQGLRQDRHPARIRSTSPRRASTTSS